MALWRCYISLCPWRLVASHFECNLDDRRIPQILRHIEGRRYLTLFVLTGASGALVHAVVNWGENAILIGASGAVFGYLVPEPSY